MFTISARVESSEDAHRAIVQTNDREQTLTIPPKAGANGSSANGGELLFLALATCYCNDIYREAARRSIHVRRVQVSVSGTFRETPGSIAENVTYNAVVEADASEDEIRALMRHTDSVAEIQNTLRHGTTVTLGEIRAISTPS